MQPVWLTADCSTPSERRQNGRSPKVYRLTGGTIRIAVADGPRRRLPGGYTVGEVRRSCAVETEERQNTEAKPYPLWDPQPMEIAQVEVGRVE